MAGCPENATPIVLCNGRRLDLWTDALTTTNNAAVTVCPHHGSQQLNRVQSVQGRNVGPTLGAIPVQCSHPDMQTRLTLLPNDTSIRQVGATSPAPALSQKF
jgi:hypothetical protein